MPSPSRSADEPLLQAVLWDMDGTLVDTEPYWIEAETELVRSFGGTWSDELGRTLVGNALPASAAVLQQAGVELQVREIIDHLIGAVIERVRRQIPWRPGARELLTELRAAGIPTALVTMSEKALAEEIVAALPQDSFRLLVTGDMVEHGKPHPEPYLRALDELSAEYPGLSADRVVALEDSVPGATSAQAAGLVTVAIPHVVPVPAAPGRILWSSLADKGIAELEQLLDAAAVLPAEATA
ncbi:haloacid dehalogenase-like hydrolase [Arthrobacter crystallopoietes BAB-32]|uniref:Haloacid dehalogenase-like hydrolase n=1 Tax=Arthrobacter crystallopoietes BAB-32 TaxID=1246476 RepID=N1UZI8_9MICC|nr:HAD family phosphatase [Arthrobacter crystallopoietes]EMY34485.1 haloacid dehalogenase-like hydrolase [Arthrobacter crystallopoietes BAB-32]